MCPVRSVTYVSGRSSIGAGIQDVHWIHPTTYPPNARAHPSAEWCRWSTTYSTASEVPTRASPRSRGRPGLLLSLAHPAASALIVDTGEPVVWPDPKGQGDLIIEPSQYGGLPDSHSRGASADHCWPVVHVGRGAERDAYRGDLRRRRVGSGRGGLRSDERRAGRVLRLRRERHPRLVPRTQAGGREGSTAGACETGSGGAIGASVQPRWQGARRSCLMMPPVRLLLLGSRPVDARGGRARAPSAKSCRRKFEQQLLQSANSVEKLASAMTLSAESASGRYKRRGGRDDRSPGMRSGSVVLLVQP